MKNKSLVLMIALLFFVSFVNAQKKIIRKAAYYDVSKPLTSLKPQANDAYKTWKDGIVKNKFQYEVSNIPEDIKDPVKQDYQGKSKSAETLITIDGVNNISGVAPPDTDGDVGIIHYVQMVNSMLQVFDKQGNSLYGPVPNSIIWDGFTGPWTGTNDGDPVVLYDEDADRWLVSQFAVNTGDGSQWELIGVSVTGDPTGAYYRYAFEFDDMPDYPHFGIWPDAYYMTINRFPVNPNGGFGPGAVAFERDQMLNGNPNARMVLFEISAYDAWSQLCADCDGTFPDAGTPNYFISFTDDNNGWPTDALKIYEFDVDWSNPANSTFTHTLTLEVDDFVSGFNDGIKQPNDQRLSTLADRLMYRVQYKKFDDYEAMVLNHTVNVGGNQAGVRWYQLRRTTGDWEVYQQGTYAPDTDSRWMASIAMNSRGDIGLGYSVSSETTYPSIRYTGRLENDPLGEMTITEESVYEGVEAQDGIDRWGDYSMMSEDPTDNATFWFTTEYTMGDWDWETKIAAFRLEDLGNPNQLMANSISWNEVELNWAKNSNSDNVLIAVSTSNNFGQPTDGSSYNDGDLIPGGGTIIYNGNATSFIHDGLDAQTIYYFKAWSVDASSNYTSGIITYTKTLCAPIYAFPFTESFEDGSLTECWFQLPDNFIWKVVAEDNTQIPSTAGSGDFYVYIKDNTASADSKFLEMPPMDLSNVENPHLFFKHFMSERIFPPSLVLQDELKIHYKTSYEGEWMLLAEYTVNVPEWTERLIELPNPSAEYFIAFEGIAKQAYGICIDDVRVGDETVFTDDITTGDFIEAYPNPSSDGVFNISLKSSENSQTIHAEVFDFAGKKITSKLLTNDEKIALDLKELPSGAYMLKLTIGSTIKHTKIVIEK